MAEINLETLLKMLKLDKNKKAALILAGGAVFAILVVYFMVFVKPVIAELIVVNRHIGGLKVDIAQVEDTLRREGLLKKRLENMRGKLISYDKQLPTEHEIPGLLEELSRIAKETSVKILGINPGTVEGQGSGKGRPYQEIPITISAQSGYHQLGNFINKMENASRFMEISNIRIKGGTADNKIHSIRIVISTYVLLET